MQRGYSSCFLIDKLNMNIIQHNKYGKTKTALSGETNTKTGNNHPQNPNTKQAT
jgi:hypothetical protein